jgi:hypothetical protein
MAQNPARILCRGLGEHPNERKLWYTVCLARDISKTTEKTAFATALPLLFCGTHQQRETKTI